MKILVTGATGLIGTELCRSLARAGHRIAVLSRTPATAWVVEDAEAFRWEPSVGPPPAEAFKGVEAVVHLAGENVAGGRWNEERKQRIRDSRVLGTRHLVEGMLRANPRPRIFVSSSAVGYYGDRSDELLDESSAPGTGFLADVCQEWERESWRAGQSGARVVVVRTGIVLSREGGALKRMLPPFKLGVGGRLGDGWQWFPWIHRDDIVGIFQHALQHTTLNGVLNGVAPGGVTNEEFAKELAAVLNRPAVLPVPRFALKLLFGEMAQALLGSQRVLPRETIASGYVFHYPQLNGALQQQVRG